MSKFRALVLEVLNEGITGKSKTPLSNLVDILEKELNRQVEAFNTTAKSKVDIDIKIVSDGNDPVNRAEIVSYYLLITQTRTIEVYPGWPKITVKIPLKCRCSTHDKLRPAKDIDVYIPDPNEFVLNKNKDAKYELYNDQALRNYISKGINDIFTVWNTKLKKIWSVLKQIDIATIKDLNTLLTQDIITKYPFIPDNLLYTPWFIDWTKNMYNAYLFKSKPSIQNTR